MKTHDTIRLSILEWLSLVLVAIGAINWGLVGLTEFLGVNLNLVNLLFGAVPTLEATVYLVVGLAGLYAIVFGYRIYGTRDVEAAERIEEGRPAK